MTQPVLGLRFGVFEVDFRAAELRKRGLRIKLQDQPFQILALLLEHPGELVTRDELRQTLWSADTFVDFDRSLNKAVNKLRLALGDSAESPRFIETVPRHGYRFIFPLNVEDGRASGAASPPIRRAVERELLPGEFIGRPRSQTGSGRVDSRPRFGFRRSSFLIGISAVALILAWIFLHWRAASPPSPPTRIPRRSVAVLSFKNISGRAEQTWLSTALSDWLTTELAAGGQLRTIPQENVARMKYGLSLPEADSLGRESLDRIRKNLGTDLVLVGSYASLGKEFGGEIRLDLFLQDTQTGETVDAISETGTESRLFDLVSRAGTRLRAKLGIQSVTPEEAEQVVGALPANPDAARLYSEGLANLRVFDALRARDLIEKAIAAEPGFALSHSALASAWAALGYDEKATVEAKKAYDLSFHLGREAHLLVEGRYREISGDWKSAIEIYRTLVQFFPDNLDYGLALSGAQVSAGLGKDALATLEILLQLPPPVRDDARIDLAEARAEESLGDFKRVQASAARAAAKAQAVGASVLLAQARGTQAWASVNLGQLDQAMALANESEKLFASADDRRGAALAATLKAIVLERMGDLVEGKRLYEESLAIYREIGNKYGVATELLNIAISLRMFGKLAAARKMIEESLETYRAIGHQDGVANAKNELGNILLALGNPTQARELYDQSLELCREIGDRSKTAEALAGLGEVRRAEGDLEGARKYEKQALALYEESGDKQRVAARRLALAGLMIDEGKWGEAAAAARSVAEEFEREKIVSDAVLAYVVMARALLGQGNMAEARSALEQPSVLQDKRQNLDVALSLEVTVARLRAAVDDSGSRSRALRSLKDALAEATRAGFVNHQFEARLALGEIEMSAGNPVKGRADLQDLENDAARRGFHLIASKAADALRGKTPS